MTWLGHPDVVAWSPERRFRLEAVSPDHPDGQGFGHRENFRFTMTEGGKVVWIAEQDAVSAIAPRELYVSDRGWSVVRTHSHFFTSVVGLSPKGERLFELQDSELFEPARLERFAGWSSTGTWWAEHSHAWFPILDGREHFCLRAWWGDRILFDLERRQKVADEPHREELEAHEAAWVLETLRLVETHRDEWNGERPDDDEDFRLPLHEALTAINFAGRSRIRSAEELLRPYESLALMGWSTGAPPLSTEDVLRDSAPESDRIALRRDLESYYFRAPAAVALRRLGAAPTGFACFRISRGPEKTVLALPECLRDLEARAACVRVGMTLLDALLLMGAPNHRHGCDSWEWDIRDDSTLRLDFDYEYGKELARIEEVRHVSPTWAISSQELDRGVH